MGRAMCAVVAGALLNALPAETIEIHVMPRPAAGRDRERVTGTLTHALHALAALRESGDSRAARIVVHGGTHEIAEPLVLDAALAAEGLDVEAAEAAAPTISGGRVLAGLREHDDGTWRVVIDDVRDGTWWFEELFAGTTPRPRARHPNTGYARLVAAGPDNRTSFTFDPAEIPPELIDTRSDVVFLHEGQRIAHYNRANAGPRSE